MLHDIKNDEEVSKSTRPKRFRRLVHRVNQPHTLLAGVAEPTGPASRLIAEVQLDDGFPLEPGVAMPKTVR